MENNYYIVLIIQIFTLLGIVVTQLFRPILQYKLEHKQKHKYTPIDKATIFINLTRICGRIQRDLKADGVYIAYFHNGDSYHNGLDIDKFTVVAESYNDKISKSYMGSYQNKPISYMAYIYQNLLTNNRFYNECIQIKGLDKSYKSDAVDRGVTNSYFFSIKDELDKPIGFISLEFTSDVRICEDSERHIWKHQISTLTNIKSYKHGKSKSICR